MAASFYTGKGRGRKKKTKNVPQAQDKRVTSPCLSPLSLHAPHPSESPSHLQNKEKEPKKKQDVMCHANTSRGLLHGSGDGHGGKDIRGSKE